MAKVVGYIRVPGSAPQLQKAMIPVVQRYCERYGLELTKIHVDECDWQAPFDERPGLCKALASLKPGDTLVVDAAESISCAKDVKMAFMLGVNELGVECHAVDGELPQLQYGGLLARFRKAVENGRSGKAKIVAEGKHQGGRVPYGFLATGRDYSFDEGPRGINLVMAMKMHDRGDSYREIAHTLNALSISGPSGGAWSHGSVRRVVENGKRLAHLIPLQHVLNN